MIKRYFDDHDKFYAKNLLVPNNPKIAKGFRALTHAQISLKCEIIKSYSVPDGLDAAGCPTDRNYSGFANAFMGKSLKNPVNCSKSLFASASRVNLPPAVDSPLVQSPPPLTVMGYRSDLFTSQQKQLSAQSKNTKSSSNSKNNLIAVGSLKNATKGQSGRWKTKLPCNGKTDLYPDPLVNSDSNFMQRISEMAALEVETIKYEKARKFKRK